MRYQILSRPPLGTRSPNSPADSRTAQRSTATCSLSLASVSASGKAGSIDSTSCSVASGSDATAMLVDSCSTSLVTVPFTVQPKPDVRVPFPKRPHSLLRSTSTTRVQRPVAGMSSVPFSTQEAESNDETCVVQDVDDHPRKRTRTSAFSSSRIQLWRSEVTPRLNPNSVPAHDSDTRLLHSPRRAPLPPLPPAEEELGLLAPTSDPVMLSSARILLGVPASKSPTLNYFWRGKRATAGELKHHLSLYRTLVHGLGRKYLGKVLKLTKKGSRSSKFNTLVTFQDALLADHLRTYLLLNGVDIQKLRLNTEEDASETNQDDSFPSAPAWVDDTRRMEVDEESIVSEVHPSSSIDITQSSSYSRSPRPPLSYQQLVATLFLRHFDPPRAPARRSTLARYPRARSALASGCISSNSY